MSTIFTFLRQKEHFSGFPPCFRSFHTPRKGRNTRLAKNRPTGLKRFRSVILKTLFGTRKGNQVIKMQTKENCMIMRPESSGTVLATHKKPNSIIRETLTQTLHKKLKIPLAKGKGGQGLTSLRITIIGARDVLLIVRQSHKITGIMILQLQHTTIGPLS